VVQLSLVQTLLVCTSTQFGKQLHTLSDADRKLIHLARALLSDPDVLIIHKPGAYFDTDMQPVIWAALRAFVDDRGVDSTRLTALGASLRPRTCIFSSSEHRNLDWVDFVVVCDSESVELARPGDLDEHNMSPKTSDAMLKQKKSANGGSFFDDDVHLEHEDALLKAIDEIAIERADWTVDYRARGLDWTRELKKLHVDVDV